MKIIALVVTVLGLGGGAAWFGGHHVPVNEAKEAFEVAAEAGLEVRYHGAFRLRADGEQTVIGGGASVAGGREGMVYVPEQMDRVTIHSVIYRYEGVGLDGDRARLLAREIVRLDEHGMSAYGTAERVRFFDVTLTKASGQWVVESWQEGDTPFAR